jgi:ATP-dependent DNA helicase PIF1
MLLRNLSFEKGLVNGARGVIEDFLPEKNNLPLVRFASGWVEVIGPEEWPIEVGGVLMASRKQIPLTLAWAMRFVFSLKFLREIIFSIHKSQGMTIERVTVELNNIFECGQAYVALR